MVLEKPYFCIMENKGNSIRNIIFDLGGVLIDLDISKTSLAFGKLDIKEPADAAEQERRSKIYSGLETGQISPHDFRTAIRDISTSAPTDDTINAAWNAMLMDFPENRKELLLHLGQEYRLFLLSNSNAIHYEYYAGRFKRDYGFEMDALFEKAYYSYKMHLKKPDPEIFLKVIEESGLRADETLFIDDSPENIKTAAIMGFKVHQINNRLDVTHLFSDGIWKG
jgi:glucose-1-phosphatase